MPITITIPYPGVYVGPGVMVGMNSDFIGPLETGTYIDLRIDWPGYESESIFYWKLITTSGVEAFILMDPRWTDQGIGTLTPAQEQQVTITSQLVAPTSGVVDDGQTTALWHPTISLGKQNYLLGQVQGQGLTDEQAQELRQTYVNTNAMDTNWQQYEQVTLPSLNDLLTTINNAVTGVIGAGTNAIQATVGQLTSWLPRDEMVTYQLGGDTCDPINVDISASFCWGVTLEITAYPEGWYFTTPDLAWSAKDLAVLRFYRGGELQDRQGVHTISHSVSPLPGITFPPGILGISVPWVPAGYHITVDWAEGVCGRLVAQRAP